MHPPASPSLGSVLSTNANGPLSSMEVIEPGEWVVFSPQMHSEASMPSPSGLDPLEPIEPLELPAHDGLGSFFAPQTASSSMTEREHDPVDSVNMWRLDQSRLIFSELQRLERRLFPGRDDETATGERSSSKSGGLWRRLGRKVLDSLALDDEVLDAIFSPDFYAADEKGEETPQPLREHFERSLRAGSADWDQAFIERLLGRPPAFPLLRRLLMLFPPSPATSASADNNPSSTRSNDRPGILISPLISRPSAQRQNSYWSSEWETSSGGSRSTAVF